MRLINILCIIDNWFILTFNFITNLCNLLRHNSIHYFSRRNTCIACVHRILRFYLDLFKMTCHQQALSLVSARYDATVYHLCSSKDLVNCKEKSFCIVTILTWDSFSPLSSLMNRWSANFVFIGWRLSFCLIIGRNKNLCTYFCHLLSWIA